VAEAFFFCFYSATRFQHILDMREVFSFVNGPSSEFLLGCLWRRTTGHGAFYGLLTARSPRADSGNLPRGAVPRAFKGGFLGAVLPVYPSEMALIILERVVRGGRCCGDDVISAVKPSGTKTDEAVAEGGPSLTPRDSRGAHAVVQAPRDAGVGILVVSTISTFFW